MSLFQTLQCLNLTNIAAPVLISEASWLFIVKQAGRNLVVENCEIFTIILMKYRWIGLQETASWLYHVYDNDGYNCKLRKSLYHFCQGDNIYETFNHKKSLNVFLNHYIKIEDYILLETAKYSLF